MHLSIKNCTTLIGACAYACVCVHMYVCMCALAAGLDAFNGGKVTAALPLYVAGVLACFHKVGTQMKSFLFLFVDECGINVYTTRIYLSCNNSSNCNNKTTITTRFVVNITHTHTCALTNYYKKSTCWHELGK